MARAKGSAAYLAASLSENDPNPVILSGIARGLDNIELSEDEDTRDVPGGGVTATRQNLGYKQGTSSISIDENDFTKGLFHGINGKRMYMTYGPDGNATDARKFDFEAIATISHDIENRGVRRFSVEFAHDGLITVGKF